MAGTVAVRRSATASRGPYNLPSDPPTCPMFRDMKERRKYFEDDLQNRFESWLDFVIRDMLLERGYTPPAPRQPRPQPRSRLQSQSQPQPQPQPHRRDRHRSVRHHSVRHPRGGRERTRTPRRSRVGARVQQPENDEGDYGDDLRWQNPGEEELGEEDEAENQEVELTPAEERFVAEYRREWEYNHALMGVLFVGDVSRKLQFHFKPATGHLLISHFAGKRSGLPLSTGYIAPYQQDRYDFGHQDLLLRLGNFQQLPAAREDRNRFIYRPFFGVELFCYRQPEGSATEEWIFLGYQNPIRRGYVPPDSSPGLGRSLQVGVHLNKSQEEGLTPQRGDVIIKGQAWNTSYNHEKNFWRSMVKWYKNKRPNFTWNHGDMLIRRFQDNCLHCGKEFCKEKYGWVELYQYDGNVSKWIFWGRCKVLLDYPWARNGYHCQPHCSDPGDDSDEEDTAAE